MANRNPPWSRDELILALELYFDENPLHTSKDNPKIAELSKVLNALPVHTDRPEKELFRNSNGVYMKLCNFLRLDPSESAKGLTAGGRLEEVIWSEFANDKTRLQEVAASIRKGAGQVKQNDVAQLGLDDDPNEEFPEGRILSALHRKRERSRAAVARKKKSVLAKTGALKCEACEFDFEARYGQIGHGFAECHHRSPLAALTGRKTTRLSDLAILCANCHRMIHRSRPMMSVEELREKVGES